MNLRRVQHTALIWTIGSVLLAASALGHAETVDVSQWKDLFAFSYDYTLVETAGLDRNHEPVEVTVSVPGGKTQAWQEHVRVVRLENDLEGEVVPHQLLGATRAVAEPKDTHPVAAPAESVNVLFLASCPAHGRVTYRLFWGLPESATDALSVLPQAVEETGLRVAGEAPGLEIANEFYTAQLDPKSGSLMNARLAGRDESETMFYRHVPMHFALDVWSPPQGWDHDYDWPSPPNQRCESGTLAVRYSRWGPLAKYPDVIASITYTFYAHVPWIHVSAIMEFTEARSARAVRIGEIVVSHTHREGPNEKDADGKSPDVFTHYGWPTDQGTVFRIEVNAHRDEEGRANLEGVEQGTLGILDRDMPWVAGWEQNRSYGMATLRKDQFAGNRLGNPIPKTVPCTYVANYGWGFTYWSRPVVYPFGARGTPEDQNTAIAAGTLFASEEALLFFEPDEQLTRVRDAHMRFTTPLRLDFKGTGPW